MSTHATHNHLIGLRELRENTARYIAAVDRGQSFTVLRHSRPVFKVVPVDEWGDEGMWETVADFTKINPRGVSIDDALSVLKKIRKEEDAR